MIEDKELRIFICRMHSKTIKKGFLHSIIIYLGTTYRVKYWHTKGLQLIR